MIQQQQLFESEPHTRTREIVSTRPLKLARAPGHIDLGRRLMRTAVALLDLPALAARHRMSRLIDELFVVQDRFPDRASLSSWLLIGAGHCRWVAGHRGGVLPIALPLTLTADREEVRGLEAALNQLIFQTPETAKQIWPAENEHRKMLRELARRVGRKA